MSSDGRTADVVGGGGGAPIERPEEVRVLLVGEELVAATPRYTVRTPAPSPRAAAGGPREAGRRCRPPPPPVRERAAGVARVGPRDGGRSTGGAAGDAGHAARPAAVRAACTRGSASPSRARAFRRAAPPATSLSALTACVVQPAGSSGTTSSIEMSTARSRTPPRARRPPTPTAAPAQPPVQRGHAVRRRCRRRQRAREAAGPGGGVGVQVQ